MDGDAERFWTKFFPSAFAEGKRFVPGTMQVLEPGALSAEGIKTWITHSAAKINLSPTQWAKEANLAPSTLNRFLKGNGPQNLSATTLEALVRVFDERFTAIAREKLGDLDKIFSKRCAFTARTEVIALLGSNINNYFEWEDERDYVIWVPIPNEYVGPPVFGFEVSDDFSPKTADLLFGCPAQTTFWQLIEGQRFLFHERIDDEQVRTSIRRLAVDPSGDRWLIKTSDHETSRAVHFDDLGPKGYNSQYFVSFFILGGISMEPWLGASARD